VRKDKEGQNGEGVNLLVRWNAVEGKKVNGRGLIDEWIGRGKMNGGDMNGKGERRGKGMNTLARGWVGYA